MQLVCSRVELYAQGGQRSGWYTCYRFSLAFESCTCARWHMHMWQCDDEKFMYGIVLRIQMILTLAF